MHAINKTSIFFLLKSVRNPKYFLMFCGQQKDLKLKCLTDAALHIFSKQACSLAICSYLQVANGTSQSLSILGRHCEGRT